MDANDLPSTPSLMPFKSEKPATRRRSALGKCNICQKEGPLTNDHIPPKGVQKIPQVDLMHVTHALHAQPPIKRVGRYFQNGVQYQSICSGCNNTVLGTWYDPDLIEMCNSVTAIISNRSVALPTIVKVATRPGGVARAVLGHILSLGLDRNETTPTLERIRNFVLDSNASMPDGILIHYWVYPYPRLVAIRDAVRSNLGFGQHYVFWCLKFFPLAFLVSIENEHEELIMHPRLNDRIFGSGLFRTDVPIHLYGLPPQNWPEAPDDSGVILFGEDAMVATSRQKNR